MLERGLSRLGSQAVCAGRPDGYAAMSVNACADPVFSATDSAPPRPVAAVRRPHATHRSATPPALRASPASVNSAPVLASADDSAAPPGACRKPPGALYGGVRGTSLLFSANGQPVTLVA